MRLSNKVAILMLAGALPGLAACGGSGSSEFASKIKESCEKSPQSANLDCACIAATMDKELDDKTKAVMLAIDSATSAGKDPAAALKEAGISESDAPELMAKLTPAVAKATTACTKTP